MEKSANIHRKVSTLLSCFTYQTRYRTLQLLTSIVVMTLCSCLLSITCTYPYHNIFVHKIIYAAMVKKVFHPSLISGIIPPKRWQLPTPAGNNHQLWHAICDIQFTPFLEGKYHQNFGSDIYDSTPRGHLHRCLNLNPFWCYRNTLVTPLLLL